MPKATRVERVYEALRREGHTKSKSARIAQSKTGLSLATGRKPKRKTADTIAAGNGRGGY